MAPRFTVCSQPGCPNLSRGGKCDECRTTASRLRGSPRRRGYDSAYDRERARALATATTCATCGEAFTEENPATGGHVVPVREGGGTRGNVAAECRRCNYGWRRGA